MQAQLSRPRSQTALNRDPVRLRPRLFFVSRRKRPSMINRMPPEMAEATRLTRLGKLMEATALIQRALGGRAFKDAGSASATVDADYTVVDSEARDGVLLRRTWTAPRRVPPFREGWHGV